MECTTCKRAIVESIGLYFLQIGHCLLQQQQHLIIGGCFADEFAWLITSGVLPEKVQRYASNALEADHRIWRHATQTMATKILICSPDTDVYNIGLSISPLCYTAPYSPCSRQEILNTQTLTASISTRPRPPQFTKKPPQHHHAVTVH